FTVITFAVAYFTRYEHIRQEMHFYFDDAVPPACFTAAALDVEAEPAFIVAADFCFVRLCKNISYIIEHTGISRRVAPWCTADRRLVDIDDFFQFIRNFYTVMISRNLFRF